MRESVTLVVDPATRRVGAVSDGESHRYREIVTLHPVYPEWLGSAAFRERFGLRFAYVGGSMARGIASVPLVSALNRSGSLGFYGAAGQPLSLVEQAIAQLRAGPPKTAAWGVNLIHSPHEVGLEDRLVDLFLSTDVRVLEASAFMDISPAVVRFALKGLRSRPDGRVVRMNHVVAKISRPELARLFFSPAPPELVRRMVDARQLTPEEARLAARLPIASCVTVEADSGGHTDGRPLVALLPAILDEKQRLLAEYPALGEVLIGAAGGLGEPGSIAAAYALGADYVCLGSVHQSAVESGVSAHAKELLAKADVTDVAMTASADMFETGVRVQVLKRGTLMPVRGNQMYALFERHGSYEEIDAATRKRLEETVFRAPIADVWRETESWSLKHCPERIARAVKDPKYKMALLFRWYLGKSSRWPIDGDRSRETDYQLWCGPALGAFNRWVRGSDLEPASARSIEAIALNLMNGAALHTRVAQLRSSGIPMDFSHFRYSPRRDLAAASELPAVALPSR